MANRLMIDEIVSVGAVDKGDDPEAAILFFKAAPDGVSKRSAGSARTAERTDMDGFDLSALDDDTREAVTQRFADMQAQIADLSGESEVEKAEDDVLKAAPDEVRDLVVKLQADLQTTTEALAAEVRSRREREFVEKSAAFTDLLGDPEQVAPVLQEVAERAPDAWAKLEGMLVAASQRSDLSALTGEIGVAKGEADPLSRRDAFVKQFLTDNPEKTEAQAASAFWAANADAIEEVRG